VATAIVRHSAVASVSQHVPFAVSEPAKPRASVYEIITSRIVEELEKGVVPWRRPWRTLPPANLVSKRPYRGINVFLLSLQGYGSQYWLTFNQAKQLGGNVRKGEHGTKIVFWKFDTYETETADGETGGAQVRIPSLLHRFQPRADRGTQSTPSAPASVPDSIGGRDRQGNAEPSCI
jgi:hypothetical protein